MFQIQLLKSFNVKRLEIFNNCLGCYKDNPNYYNYYYYYDCSWVNSLFYMQYQILIVKVCRENMGNNTWDFQQQF